MLSSRQNKPWSGQKRRTSEAITPKTVNKAAIGWIIANFPI